MAKFVRHLSLSLVLLCSFVFSGAVSAQLSATPSPAQIEQFKKLPKAQQEALAKQFGIDLRSLNLGGGSTKGNELNKVRPEDKYLNPELSSEFMTGYEEEKEDDSLKPFGYDMFEELQDAFLPDGNLPIPADYVVGPGDTLEVNLFGKESSQHELTVNNLGQINIPGLEPLTVAGISFSDLKTLVSETVKTKMIGIKSTVTLLNLRGIQVYLVGDLKKPGAYQLSSLSTITNALFISGGPSEVGSLRNIELKRGGKTIAKLDLYDMFTKGDVSQDKRLQQGDVIFVDSIKSQVSISGEVRRPAIYETKKGDTISELVSLAGGLTVAAYPKNLVLASFDENYQRQVLSIDLENESEAMRPIKNGDVLTVMKVSEQFSQVVNVAGTVSRPGTYSWNPGFALTDLITNKDDLLQNTDLDYALILSNLNSSNFSIKQFKPRDIFTGNQVELLPGDLVLFVNKFEQATFEIEEGEEAKRKREISEIAYKNFVNNSSRQFDSSQSSELDFYLSQFEEEEEEVQLNYLHTLRTGDLFEKQKVLLETKDFSREELIQPIVKLLEANSQIGKLTPLVEITGQVRFPGQYPISSTATVLDAIWAGGGLTESANLQKGEVSRITQSGNHTSSLTHLEFELGRVFTPGSEQNLAIKPRDVVNVFQKANWQEELKITLEGEVRYPGEYTINEGETLTEVIERAGGLTEFAAPDAAFFTRHSLKELEQKQAKNMARGLSKELAFKSISSSYANVNVSEVQLLVNQLTTIEGVGRLVVDLPKLLAKEVPDVRLENGDTLRIPTYRNEVNVMGEVQVATSHIHNEKWNFKNYIKSSGGLRQQADDDRIYVIRANGLVDVPEDSWFGSEKLAIRPGDTIVVPLDAGYTDKITLWEKATAIFYQITVGLAALGRL